MVINEIMYNPISGNNDDEYVEIYNRSTASANLAGWEFIVGITYTFPTNAITMNMPPGAHWVVAKNPTNLFAIYSNLNSNNTFGPYGGTLANGGERLTFAAADYDTVVGGTNQMMEVKLNVPVSDVTYGDGGKWGNWSDGAGASLELIDPEADTHVPSNWADSDDTGESAWTAIEWTGPIGETLGTPANDSLIILMQGIGECLLDEVEVRADNGPNLVANGGFEDDLNGWTLQGSHDFSTIENAGFAGSKSLHVRAGSRGDNQSNRILSAPFVHPIPATARVVTLRAKVKWSRGHPEILLRLHGGGAEAYGRMALPRKLGTPGAVNSRRVTKAGPGIYDVKHSPILPAATVPVVVTARAVDRLPITSLRLKYRVDPATEFSTVEMLDTGTDGDAIANDGVFSGVIPGQNAGEIVAWYIEGKGSNGFTSTFPSDLFPPAGLTRCWPIDAVARECVVRWGETQMPGDFATYHLWLTSANSNRWHTRHPLNNTPMDGTFVYNNSRVIYNALPLYSGSPWHRTNSTTGPAGPNRVDYEMNFPEDDSLLGATDFVLNNPGNPEIDVLSDLSAMAEQTVNKIIDGMGTGLVHNHRRYVHFFVNGNQRSTTQQRPGNFIFEDSQQPNGDMIDQWFPNDAGGQLFKAEDWFEFEPNGFDFHFNNDADLTRRTIPVNGQPTLVPAPYRFMFRKRSVSIGNSANDYSPIFALVDAVSPAENPTNSVVDPDQFGAVADWEEWMRFFAVQRAVGNWDSYGWDRGKNDYFYKPVTSGFTHMTWDIDYCLGLGRPANEPLFASNDPRVRAMFNTPVLVRAYWRAFTEMVNGPFSNSYLDPFLDAHATALTNNGVNIDLAAVAAIKTYLHDRRTYLLTQIATVTAPFAINGPPSFSTDNNLVVLVGTAPVNVKTILLNGTAYPITWTSATNFTLRLVLSSGINSFVFQGLDRFGATIPAATYSVNVNYTGPVANPIGSLLITEIMYAPGVTGGQFIELVNRSAQNFDLTGWRMDGVSLTFPAGSIVTNGQTFVVAQNKTAFNSAYGNGNVLAVFSGILSPQGQSLMLVRPGLGGDEFIDGVRYESTAPWPQGPTGASLQLIDAAQDNSRPSNWAMDSVKLATPGASNSVAAILPAYDSLWLNEFQAESQSGPLDELSEIDPWFELYNGGTTSLSLDGYFLMTNYTTNAVSFPFPPGTMIAPGEHKLIWADGQPEQGSANWHTSFRLDYAGRLALARMVNGRQQITDYLTWSDLGVNVSYGSTPDGQSVNRGTIPRPTPGAANLGPNLRVFINEWLTRNTLGLQDPADNAFEDWIELYNAETQTIDLGGFYLTDNLNQRTKFRIPATGRYTIPPGGYLVVFADNQANQNSLARPNLHVNFSLGTSSGTIALYAPNGVTQIDGVSYGQQTNDVSEGRYGDGASVRNFMLTPTPGGPNGSLDYNTRPKFPPIPQQFVSPGQTLTVLIKALDPDVPPQTVTYQVEEGPAASQLNQGGLYRWIVPANQTSGDYPVTLRVTDGGTPPRSSTKSFIITVRSSTPNTGVVRPLIYSFTAVAGQTTFTFDTIIGRTYRVLYTDDLAVPWTQLDRDFVAANSTGSITDNVTASQRFYKVVRLD